MYSVYQQKKSNANNARQEDIATVPITKGGMGFGFTIADSAYGQKVKKILKNHDRLIFHTPQKDTQIYSSTRNNRETVIQMQKH